ncbi:MAG TPA: hypothetical protein VL475_14080, partial [Planctomycetaceae bacterium]|nr:hypothetical protein [Planctomycetaceae bacterium]
MFKRVEQFLSPPTRDRLNAHLNQIGIRRAGDRQSYITSIVVATEKLIRGRLLPAIGDLSRELLARRYLSG